MCFCIIVAGEVENGDVSKNLKYMCHTTKNLDMIRIFLKNTKDKNTEEGIMHICTLISVFFIKV